MTRAPFVGQGLGSRQARPRSHTHTHTHTTTHTSAAAHKYRYKHNRVCRLSAGSGSGSGSPSSYGEYGDEYEYKYDEAAASSGGSGSKSKSKSNSGSEPSGSEDAGEHARTRKPPASASTAASTTTTTSSSSSLFLPPEDWETWLSYIKETRETESRVRELESRIEGECEREDYRKACEIHKELKALLSSHPDAMRVAQEELKTLVEQSRFKEASVVRDEAGTRFGGWWVGRCEGEGVEDPYGHIICAEPQFASLVATGYCGQDLTYMYHSTKDGHRKKRRRSNFNFQEQQDKGREDEREDGGARNTFIGKLPGEVLWELFIRKKNNGRKKGKGGYEQMMVTYSLLANESLDFLSGNQIPEDLQDLLHDISAAEVEEGGDSEQVIAEVTEELVEDLVDWEEKDIFRRADEDEETTDWEDLRRAEEAAELFGIERAAGHDPASMLSEVELLANELDSLEEVPRPAELIAGDNLDAFKIVWQHPRVEFILNQDDSEDEDDEDGTLAKDVKELRQSKGNAYAELLLALKELVKDASSKVGSAKQKEQPLSSIYADSVSSVDTLELLRELDGTSADADKEQSHEQLVVNYSRLDLDKMQWHDPFTGIYYANYGVHGVELLKLERQRLADDMGVFDEYVVGTKLTGDPNVPTGEISFKACISQRNKVSGSAARLHYPEELQVKSIYKGEGQTASEGFVDPNWVDGDLLVLGPNSVIAEGAPLAFVFCMDLSDDDDEEEEDEEEEEEDFHQDERVTSSSSSSSSGRTRKVVILLHKLDLTKKKELHERMQQ